MRMSFTTLVAAAAFAGAISLGAHAQTHSDTHSGGHSTSPSASAKAVEMSEGEVRRVDKENKKITLKHGVIKNLDMPAMTMVFNVNDAAILETVKAGDKVRFTASSEAGKFIVIDLQPAN
jgi:Cu/Ag efflux protein CusF